MAKEKNKIRSNPLSHDRKSSSKDKKQLYIMNWLAVILLTVMIILFISYVVKVF